MRSMREAKCVKSLTLAGLIFIPLIYTSSLFSMNDRYIPGASNFWICFVVSQSIMPTVLLSYYVGYDEKAEWSFETFKNSLGKSLGVRNVKESLPER
jgi:hypothetical protein